MSIRTKWCLYIFDWLETTKWFPIGCAALLHNQKLNIVAMTGEGLKKNLLRPIVNLSWPNPVARRTMLLSGTLGFKLSSWAHTSASQVSILAFTFFRDVIRYDFFKCLSRALDVVLGRFGVERGRKKKRKSHAREQQTLPPTLHKNYDIRKSWRAVYLFLE